MKTPSLYDKWIELKMELNWIESNLFTKKKTMDGPPQ